MTGMVKVSLCPNVMRATCNGSRGDRTPISSNMDCLIIAVSEMRNSLCLACIYHWPSRPMHLASKLVLSIRIKAQGKTPTVSANRTHSSTPLTNVSSAAGRISCPHTITSSNVPCSSRTLTGSSASVSPSSAVPLCGCWDAGSTRSVGVAMTPKKNKERN